MSTKAPRCPECRQPIAVMWCVDGDTGLGKDMHWHGDDGMYPPGSYWMQPMQPGYEDQVFKQTPFEHRDWAMRCGNCHADLGIRWEEHMVEWYPDEFPELLPPDRECFLSIYVGHDETTGDWTGKPNHFRDWYMDSVDKARERMAKLSAKYAGAATLEIRADQEDDAEVLDRAGELAAEMPPVDPCALWMDLFGDVPSDGWFQDMTRCDPKYAAEDA